MIDDVLKEHKIYSIEMESFHMMDLAECSKGKLRAGSAAIVLAQRRSVSIVLNDGG